MNLKRIHFLRWNEKYYDELIQNIEHIYKQKVEDNVKDIFVTGSRIYELEEFPEKIFFNENSDLDVLLYFDTNTYLKYFVPTNMPQSVSKGLLNKFKNKFDTFLQTFIFYDVKVTIFAYNILMHRRYRKRYILPMYSLYKRKLYKGNKRHLLDYLTNMKGRLEPFSICFICYSIDNKPFHNLQFNHISEYQIYRGDERDKVNWNTYICHKCYNKYFKNGWLGFYEYI